MSAILKKQGIDTKEFNAQELNYLLSLISKSNFEGRDVFVVADINEVQILNQAISNSTIKGSDAKTVSVIITKLEKEFERLYKLQEKK